MDSKLFYKFGSCAAAFIVAVGAGALLLAPSSVQAQTYYLRYQILIGSTDSGTQNNTYDSGLVQSTSVLTTNLVGPGSVASAYATPSASFGQLQLTASCSVNNTQPNGNGHGSRFYSGTGGGTDVMFQDSLTPTSATLPFGTPVQIQIASGYDGYITPGVTTGDPWDSTFSAASVGLFASGDVVGNNNNVSGPIGGLDGTNFISLTVGVTIGTPFSFFSSITADANANNQDGAAFVGSVNTAITSRTYVTVLTPGAGYTAASGTVYPTLQLPPPTLTIQAINNQSALISWPSVYVNYVLQQNPGLGTTNWLQTTNTVSLINGTNQVTAALTTNNMFFRLVQQ